MTQYSRLSALLEAEEAPTRRSLQDAVDAAIQDPRQISCIAENDVRDGLILRLTTHSDVLAQFFSRVQSAPATSKTPAASKIAADTINLLILLLPPLQQLLELTRLVELLIPALSVCLEPREPIGLPKLASVLATCGDLLEQLVACPLSSTIICRWASLPAAVALGNVTQETWTHRLVAMVLSCTIDHKIAETMREWEKLKRLKNGLYELERRLLDEEDKRASVARKKQTVIPFPTLEDDLQSLLSDFALAQPGSFRVVQNHIETLSGGRTSRILRLITKQFPCKHCIAGLGSPSRNIELEARDEIAGATSDLHVDILGKDLGVWKVALSEPALRSWQAKENLGLSAQMREKLVDLANGYHTGRLAGSDGQRHRLKVPLTSTKCGKGLSIIWQVHEKLFGEAQTLHQIVIVWEIGDSKAVTKAIDIVISIQMGYSDDTIRRCRQRPSTSNGAQLPLEFEDGNLPLCRTPQAPAELDIRTVDQETIHMANKFYALSEAVIRSVLANDLAAEFPFELSWEEARCINHRETASLILGRSGTGKTTCLVFKVVGKFVASKAVLDERPVRQVSLIQCSCCRPCLT